VELSFKAQAWTSLIAMLLLRYLQLCSHFTWFAIEPGDATADEPVDASRSVRLAGGTADGIQHSHARRWQSG
jgi:hypothetical protein